jgi:hypothetical protein
MKEQCRTYCHRRKVVIVTFTDRSTLHVAVDKPDVEVDHEVEKHIAGHAEREEIRATNLAAAGLHDDAAKIREALK